MAKISPKLQKLIDDKAVMLFVSEGAAETISRRKLVSWNVRTADGTYRVERATIERMNRRADAGQSFDADAMRKVARPHKAEIAAAGKAAAVAANVKPRHVKLAKALDKGARIRVSAKGKAKIVEPSKPAGEDTHVILVFDESGSMQSQLKEINAQATAIRDRLVAELPVASVEVCRFGSNTSWSSYAPTSALPSVLNLSYDKGATSLYLATTEAATKAIASNKPCLVYLLTDGEPCYDRGTVHAATYAVKRALDTKRVTFACVGPERAAAFFESCGIPKECVRRWDGADKADLGVVTRQAAQGVSSYAAARSVGKTRLDSFFVDVVAQGVTVDKVRKELRDVTSSLRRRKITKFEEMADYVKQELKRDYVPGAGYYPLQKAETLKVGRRVILQPRGEDAFYAGPAARKLLGLPEDRDAKVEPKNLGDLVVYFQSASPNRKLLPGTTFLYDESHVAGATAPTWSAAQKTSLQKAT